MSKLSIRIKMTLWYSLLTFSLLMIFLPVLYGLISKSMYTNEVGILRNAASQAILACEIENDNLTWNEGTQIPASVNIAVVKTDGKVLFSNSNMKWLASGPFYLGKIQTLSRQNVSWLVYDESIKNENQLLAYVRVCVSLENVEASLDRIQIIMLLASPIYLFIAIFGGLFIARKALSPISQITKTAAEIEHGDLSLRIKDINSKDEVGHLAGTFNTMLDHLETSFHRERQFSSDASHELRTPVSIIMTYSEALIDKLKKENKTADDDELKSLELIHGESEKMNVIISQLLMLSRGYEGKYPKEIERIDLNEIISSVVEQMQETAAESNISLLYTQKDELIFMADQTLITQMLINLVQNGIKYGKPGGYVGVSAQKEADGMHIIVEDNGIGISETDLPNIFDRFYRVDQSRNRSGTGLGLSIVKWIVNEHNGKISVNSKIDKGTTFSIFI